MRHLAGLAAALSILIPALATPGVASAQEPFDVAPWMEDMVQLKSELNSHYSHLDWAVRDREADLPQLWGMAQGRLAQVRNEAEAREVFDRFLAYFGDGHLKMNWATQAPPSTASQTQGASSLPAPVDCGRLGFRARPDTTAVLSRASGYRPLSTDDQAIFPAGLVTLDDGRTVGVLRIQGFAAKLNDQVCPRALAALAIQPEQPCDDDCRNAILGEAWTQFNAAFIRQVTALGARNPDGLIVDLAGNGGGSEWAEVAGRVLTPVRVRSSTGGMVRHPHSVARLQHVRDSLAEVTPRDDADRVELARLDAVIVAKQSELARPCDAEPLWRGESLDCDLIVRLNDVFLAAADPNEMRALPWGSIVFGPIDFEYQEGVWRGPLMVLVDQKTGSAAEEFAGLLQQNSAAIVVGAPTAGAGCGHTAGGIQTVLKNSGARVLIPDCVRYDLAGNDDNSGVDPDVLVGFRPIEGDRRRVARALAALPEALSAAEALQP